MKNYKAVVIDGHKLIKGVAVILTVIFLMLTVILDIHVKENGTDFSGNRHAYNIIGESIPVFSSGISEDEGGTISDILRKTLAVFLTFDPFDQTSVLSGEIPLIHIVENGYLAIKARGDAIEVYNPENADIGGGNPGPDMPQGGQYPIKAVDSSQKKALGNSKAKILIRNETDYSIDIEEMLNGNLDFDMKGDGPKILILHTHATECYTEDGESYYFPDKSDRSLEEDKNVIAVGEKIKQIFEKNGIETIHDKTMHDHPNFNGSYANSLKTVEVYKTKYPSIRIVLDIHRDAYVYDDGSKAKFVTKINGKNAAQLMLVVGTNAGGLEHPNWRENMRLALKLQKHISESYPTLMRGVNLRKERFNGHTTTGSMIIEVGSSGNTLDEALNGAEYAAEKISEFLKMLL